MNDSTAQGSQREWVYIYLNRYAYASFQSYLCPHGTDNSFSETQQTQQKNTGNNNENTTHETYRFRSRFERRLMSESSWGSSRPGHAVIHEKFCGWKDRKHDTHSALVAASPASVVSLKCTICFQFQNHLLFSLAKEHFAHARQFACKQKKKKKKERNKKKNGEKNDGEEE